MVSGNETEHNRDAMRDTEETVEGDGEAPKTPQNGQNSAQEDADAEEVKREMMEDIRQRFIKNIVDNMTAFGATSAIGRVLGTIYMNGDPMTLDELSKETGMSKTRMSQVTRDMDEVNLAERVFQKGVRKDLFQVEQDYYQTFISIFTATWQKATNRGRHFEQDVQRILEDMKKQGELSSEDEQFIQHIQRELEEWNKYHDWIRRVTAFFESGEIFNHVPKEP